MPDGARLKIET